MSMRRWWQIVTNFLSKEMERKLNHSSNLRIDLFIFIEHDLVCCCFCIFTIARVYSIIATVDIVMFFSLIFAVTHSSLTICCLGVLVFLDVASQ